MRTDHLTPIEGVVSISVTYDDNKYTLNQLPLSQPAKAKAKGTPSNITIFRVITYFDVRDKNGAKVNNFQPPLKFHIEYSSNHWNVGIGNNKNKNYKRPRLAYLSEVAGNWAPNWVEFSSSNISSFSAPAGGKNGKVVLTIKTIPDPLIGGC
ncbi:MAG: hypothetical protein E4H33_03555 [Anaerolineales bacterium]|nr:MAG: hypothetical protein E4H33_03555 [Anaerolineales bacterium]